MSDENEDLDDNQTGGELKPTNTARAARPSRVVNERAARVLACSIYEKLCSEGCSTRDVISVSSQLISLVTADIKNGEQRDPQ